MTGILFDGTNPAPPTSLLVDAVAAKNEAVVAKDQSVAAQVTSSAAAVTANQKAGQAAASADLSDEARDEAVVSAASAAAALVAGQSARDATLLAAAAIGVYASTALGLAAASLGQTFYVASGGAVALYREDAGPVATLIATLPSQTVIDAINASMAQKAALAGATFVGAIGAPSVDVGGVLIEASPDYGIIVKDPAGNILVSVDLQGVSLGFGGAVASSPGLVAPIWGKTASPAALSRIPSNVLGMVGGSGQSNMSGVNTNAADAIVSSTPVYPDHALMVPGGPLVSAETGADLVPLVESVSGTRRETPCSGLVNNLIAKMEAAYGFRPKIAMLLSAETQKKLTELNRGSTRYNLLLAGVRDATAYARRNGLVPIYFGTAYTQGESETNITHIESHVRGLKRLARDLSADIRAITGQADEPLLYCTQVATGHSRDLWSASWFPDAAGLATYEADGSHLIRLIGPMYQFQISPDDLHLACPGQYQHGAQYAEGIFDEIAKQGSYPIKYVGALWRSSTVLRLEYAVPDNGSLAIVTAEAVTDTVDSVHGYQAIGPTGAQQAIASVTVPASIDAGNISAHFVDVTFATAPNGPVRLSYAHRRDGTDDVNGPVGGMRGCLATSATYIPLIGGPQRRWAAAHIIDVPGI